MLILKNKKEVVKMHLEKFYTITGLMRLEGTKIGGTKENVDIAESVDSPIIRHPISGIPYIPGSSFKGKIRSLLELKTERERLARLERRIEELETKMPPKNNNKELERRLKQLKNSKAMIEKGDPCGCGDEECIVCKAFGPHKNTDHKLGPTRLIFRDVKIATKDDIKKVNCLPQDSYDLETIKSYSEDKGLYYSEIKSENIINRHTGRAEHPRQMERIIDGTVFKFEIVVRVFEGDEKDEDENKKKEENKNPVLRLLKKGFELLQKDYLGGSGTRGYGKVVFYDVKIDNKPWCFQKQRD